jgi:hypothetical protein
MNDCGENNNDMDMELGTQSKGSAGPRIGESALGRRERRMGRPDNEGEDEEQEAPTLVLIRAFLPGTRGPKKRGLTNRRCAKVHHTTHFLSIT